MTFTRMWAELAPIGRDQVTGGHRRFAWTEADATLRDWFVAACRARGLNVEVDRAGNLWGWWLPDGVPSSTPGIVAGSHLDSVPDGGAFDGPLGVVSALAAVDLLRERGFAPARPLGVVCFSDEEGARFGIACAGSRLLTGVLTPERALALRDADGVTMAAAMSAAGLDPGTLGPDPAMLARVAAYLEVHIEQGRGLVDLHRPLAVASGIWPHGRWRIDLPGEANHAGTTRLMDRRDAMVSCARVVLAARAAAEHWATVATVGKVVVVPGGVNAIPSAVTAWLDVRGADSDAVRATVAEVTTLIDELGGSVAAESWTPATTFDEGLRHRLVALLEGAPVLATAAGHDAGILANAGVPTAMIFVRSPDGVSHSPTEHADLADCLAGVEALAAALNDLAG